MAFVLFLRGAGTRDRDFADVHRHPVAPLYVELFDDRRVPALAIRRSVYLRLGISARLPRFKVGEFVLGQYSQLLRGEMVRSPT
jgi:hypothetical protein